MPQSCWSNRLAGWMIVFAIITWNCHAESIEGCRIEIVGAEELMPLLDQHLQILRLTREHAIGHGELGRLISITPQKIQDLLETEGYFSSKIVTDIYPENKNHLSLTWSLLIGRINYPR